MEMFGWDTWGYCLFSDHLGRARLYRHYTGLTIAVPESYEGDPFSLLSQMNSYLEDEAGIERPLSDAEREQENRDLTRWQNTRDMAETVERLSAENAGLRRRLGLTGTAEAPWGKAHRGECCSICIEDYNMGYCDTVGCCCRAAAGKDER